MRGTICQLKHDQSRVSKAVVTRYMEHMQSVQENSGRIGRNTSRCCKPYSGNFFVGASMRVLSGQKAHKNYHVI